MDRDSDGDFLDFGGHLGEIDQDDLVITIACTGQIITSMLDSPCLALQIVVEDEVLIA